MKNGISVKLKKAREYEQEALQRKIFSKKPIFHVCAPVGWINDPNGFSEYKGEKHLFFQYHPYDTNWGPMHWGHVKTIDFIKWENLPVALAPDKKYDSFGCFSGSATEHEGKHILAYTGVVRKKLPGGKFFERQRMCIAVGDGINYTKIKANPVIGEELLAEGFSKVDFRDPKIWEENGTFYLLAGNRAKDLSGQVLLFESKDLENWSFVRIFDRSLNRYGKMWECPDLFDISGQRILMVSPQEMVGEENLFHQGDNSIFILGDDKGDDFIEREIVPVDFGLDFYAPQTMKTSDGRRVMVAWLASWASNWFDAKDGFSGMMTIPRELTYKEGKIYQRPVREIERYYSNEEIISEKELSKEDECFEELSGRTQDVTIRVLGEENARFFIKIAAYDDFFTGIEYDFAEGVLTFDRTYSGSRRDCAQIRRIKIEPKDQTITLRILMDLYSVEVFVNDGEKVLTNVIRTPLSCDRTYMRAGGKVIVDALKHDICVN